MGLVSSFRRIIGLRATRIGACVTVAVAAAICLGLWMRLIAPELTTRSTTSISARQATIDADVGSMSRSRIDRDSSERGVTKPIAVGTVGKVLGPVPLPLPDTPHDIAIAQLKPMAEAGRTDAMRMLSAELRDCHFADNGSDVEIRQHSIDQILRFEQRMSGGEQYANETGWVELQTAHLIDLRDACAHVDGDEAVHWFDWLARAASMGDTTAMIAYAGLALTDSRTQPDAWDTDAIAQRKAQAGEYLWQALEQGDCSAMQELEIAYDPNSGFGIFDADPVMTYAFAWARWDWYRENHPDSAPEMTEGWLQYLAKAEAKVAEDQRGAAQWRGDALYARYCRGHPET